jgi:hypothetical protein
MKLTANEEILTLFAVCGVAIAVVVIDAKPENEAYAVAVTRGKLLVTKQRAYGIAALLYRKHGVAAYAVRAEQSVAGGDKHVLALVYRAATVLYPAAKAIVEAAEIIRLKIRKVNVVFLYEFLYHRL